jgi:gliding motility-associated-like protein
MKRIIYFILFACFKQVIGQTYVTIPDANFVSYLQSTIPAAMNGNQMDTSNTLVKTTTGINVNGMSISNLYGIQYFKALTYLICAGNSLINLPALPDSLTYLECNNNQLTSLPALPNSFKNLNCYNNQLTSLPTLPSKIQTLWCSGNQLTSLPALPNALGDVRCSYNQLTSLPTLPTSLTILQCNHNHLTNIPKLPNSLMELWCDSNNIACFPQFPNSIGFLIIDPNPYICLPNYISAMNAATLAYPLCDLNNSNGCPASIDVPTQIIIPNIFTPNGDNINDTFFIKASNLTNFSCKIYNRWGILLYQWNDINSSWNGKDKSGENAADGTYYYVISYIDNINKANIKNGFFQLIK